MNLAIAQEKLAGWIAAEDAVQKGQNYSIDGMAVTRADLEKISQQITKWSRTVNNYQRIDGGGQAGVKTAVWS